MPVTSTRLCELMTEDHVFQDALGKRFVGRETLRGGWKAYYQQISDYKVRGEEFFQDKNVVAVFGTASGTSKQRRQIFQRRLLANSRGVESHGARRPDCGMVRVRGIVRA